jgi:hypothetical protein
LKAIIYKTESEADNLQELFYQAIKPIVDANTTAYSNVIKHTTQNLWAVQVAVNGFQWDVISEAVGSKTIETLTEDWFPKNDLEI